MAEKRDSISFPLSSSTMVSNHLIPYLPEQYTQYTFKKTSWKKAATFLKKYLEREGIVKTKDRGGETIILSIDWNHKLIAQFQPYTLSRRPAEQTDTKSTGPANSTPQMVEIRELYKPTGKVLRSILDSQSKSYGHGGAEGYRRKDELYNSVQIREALSEYINQNKELVDPRNPR
jgi:translation initiation factor 2D